jgi:transposase InsO family protein
VTLDRDEFFTVYNEERPHMRLDWDALETPADAIDRLLPDSSRKL